MKAQTSYLGIDVSKSKLHLATDARFLGQFDNSPPGRQTLVQQLVASGPTLVALEASGGYERPVCQTLQEAGLAVAVVQPGCVRHFAKSLKVLAKTDRIDAQMIARFAATAQPRATPPERENRRKMRALCERRQQIVEDRVRETNRLETCFDPAMAKHIQEQLEHLQQLEADLDQQIQTLVEEDAEFRQTRQTLMTPKGIGAKTAATLLAHLPELGTLTRGEIAAIAGLAPHPQDSGNWHGKRRIYGGRAAVRQALYMAAKTAARWCPVISVFYQRLRAQGKPYNVALIACARKMLIHLNTLVKQQNNRQQKNSDNSAPATAQTT
jgi:transposase